MNVEMRLVFFRVLTRTTRTTINIAEPHRFAATKKKK